MPCLGYRVDINIAAVPACAATRKTAAQLCHHADKSCKHTRVAEYPRTSDAETDDHRPAVVAQPLLDAFALFEIVVCHALVTVWISILPRCRHAPRHEKQPRSCATTRTSRASIPDARGHGDGRARWIARATTWVARPRARLRGQCGSARRARADTHRAGPACRPAAPRRPWCRRC